MIFFSDFQPQATTSKAFFESKMKRQKKLEKSDQNLVQSGNYEETDDNENFEEETVDETEDDKEGEKILSDFFNEICIFKNIIVIRCNSLGWHCDQIFLTDLVT